MLLAPIVTIVMLLSSGLDDALTDARKLLDQADWSGAERVLRAALDEGSGDQRALTLMLAEALLGSGQAAAAIETLDGIDTGTDHEVALALGKASLGLADAVAGQGAMAEDVELLLADARSHFERAVSHAPAGDTRALVGLGNCELYRFLDYPRALEIAEVGLRDHPQDAELLLLRGCARVYDYWDLAQAKDDAAANEAWNGAVDDLLAAEKGLPRGRTEAWAQLAWLYEHKGIPTKAVDAAIKIVDQQTEPSYDTLYRLALRYSGERRFDAAGKALEKMASLNAREITNRLRAENEGKDEIATLLSWSVGPFVDRNDFASARTILASIIAAEPAAPVIWDNYAVCCQMTRRFEESVQAYEHRLTLDDTDPRTYNDLAAVLHHDLDRELDRAAELYRKCIAMSEEQLAREDLADDLREHLTQARSLAQGNLDELEPPKGLLDSVLEGLSSLNVPELPADDEAQDPPESGGTNGGSSR